LADGEKIFTTFKRGAVNLARVGAEVGGAGTTGQLIFETAISSTSTERLRIDSSGRLLVGTFTTIANKSYTNGAINPQFEIDGTGVPTATLTITNWNTAAASPAHVVLSKSKSGTVGTRTLVANNDDIGAVVFTADDGTAFIPAASILAEVDGTPAGPTPGPVSMPGRLVFSTTASGASSPTPRMRIDSSGKVGIGTTSPAAVLTTYAGGFDPSDNTVFDGVGLFLESSVATGDGNYGSALAWNRPGSSTNFKCAIAPVQEGADVDLQGLAFFTADGTFTTSDPAERLRIDSIGRLLVGTSSYSGTNTVKLQGNSGAATGPAYLGLGRGQTPPSDGAGVGYIFFEDDTDNRGAAIQAFADGGAWVSGSNHRS
jgi:hypothetical protein